MRDVDGGSQALGDLVRMVRAKLGETQHQFAPRLGVTRSSIANIEAGRQEVAASKLLPLLLDLGIIVMAGEVPISSDAQRKQALSVSVAGLDAALMTLHAARDWLAKLD